MGIVTQPDPIVIINWQNSSRSLNFSLADVGFSSANARDLWSGADLGQLQQSLVQTRFKRKVSKADLVHRYQTTVEPHGSIVLKLSAGVTASSPSFQYYPAIASNNILAGNATSRIVNSTLTVVSNIGEGGTLTFTNIEGCSGGTRLASIDYINADYTFSNTACSNCRNVWISVNGNEAVQVQMPISGQVRVLNISGCLINHSGFMHFQSWDIVKTGYLVSLSGFNPGSNNTVQFSNPNNASAPDIYQMGMEK